MELFERKILHQAIDEKLIEALKSGNPIKLDIPVHIKDNINKELRKYQENAIINYLANNKTIGANHLMFNMATGSGKTLVMACLLLDCYKRGYRNFVFFVNSKAVLEKTKENFCYSDSPKYLFNGSINIDGEQVEINEVSNFDDSKQNAINIYFDTIQGLHNQLTNERENSITLNDLSKHKIVLLADEAHHLNSDTKKTLTGNEKEIKDGWESVIREAFNKNSENLLLEFTATIPNDDNVKEKYVDKLIYEYPLKNFCNDGYSKKIMLVKYNNSDIKTKILGALILSIYRQVVAADNSISLKPVVLFKSERKDASKENQIFFNEYIDNLDESEIKAFYENIDFNNTIFSASYAYFLNKWGIGYANKIIQHIKDGFRTQAQINTNDDKDYEKNQKLLNSLENENNVVRAIFSVDKLNEGWDTLNLFDIVRLGNASGKNTTREAQLIGRGARYYPFGDDEKKYERKYDKVNNELEIIEKLSYHSTNNSEYIARLEKEVKDAGMLLDEENDKIMVDLELSDKAKAVTKNNEIYYVKNYNRRSKKTKIIGGGKVIAATQSRVIFPYISDDLEEQYVEFSEEIQDTKTSSLSNNKKIEEAISLHIFRKAVNIVGLNYAHLKSMGFNCVDELYEKLKQLGFLFHKNQKFENPEVRLKLAKHLVKSAKEILLTNVRYDDVSEFQAYKFSNYTNRKILRNKDKIKQSHNYEWLFYKQYSFDSELENQVLNYIEKRKNDINAVFDDWLVIRNEGFEEFKIYDNREDNDTYGVGFEPDFIFFGKKKINEQSEQNNNKADNVNYLNTECIIESKGSIYFLNNGKDKWKEEFILSELNHKSFHKVLNKTGTIYKQNDLTVIALPFYLGDNDKSIRAKEQAEFDEQLNRFKKQFNDIFNDSNAKNQLS